MEVTIVGAEGLPEAPYLSMRVGEVRKQAMFQPGECFRFDVKKTPRHFQVDIFEKVGSKQVSLADFLPLTENGEQQERIEVSSRNGSCMKLDLKVALKDAASTATAIGVKKLAQHEAALKAKHYLDGHAVLTFLQGMIHELLAAQPEDPVGFMSAYLQEHGEKTLAPGSIQAAAPPLPPRDHEQTLQPRRENSEEAPMRKAAAPPLPPRDHEQTLQPRRDNSEETPMRKCLPPQAPPPAPVAPRPSPPTAEPPRLTSGSSFRAEAGSLSKQRSVVGRVEATGLLQGATMPAPTEVDSNVEVGAPPTPAESLACNSAEEECSSSAVATTTAPSINFAW